MKPSFKIHVCTPQGAKFTIENDGTKPGVTGTDVCNEFDRACVALGNAIRGRHIPAPDIQENSRAALLEYSKC